MREVVKSRQYDGERVKRNMLDAGCSEKQVSCFCECMQQGKKKDELEILEKRRDELLQEIHAIKDLLEELDKVLKQVRSETV